MTSPDALPPTPPGPPVLPLSLSLPVIGAPMFIVSNPELVVAQCTSGVVGSFPALNARPRELLDAWLARITSALARFAREHPGTPVAPFAVNQIIHPSNDRLSHDLELCAKHRVPVIITSLSAPTAVVPEVHAWGGVVFHDVTTVRHARKAIEAGVDGLILVCAGAGGHAGTQSTFALVQEVRRFWTGPLARAGAISTGRGVLAARALGADFAYVGTRFIATTEANADGRYKQMILDSSGADIVYTAHFSGVPGNYLRQSIANAGLDPDALAAPGKSAMSFSSEKIRPWRDIWSAGQGVGMIDDVPPAAEVIATLRAEYEAARAALG